MRAGSLALVRTTVRCYYDSGQPKRLRDKAHLKFVASQPCLVCGRQPSGPHHLCFAQPRAIGLKVSDEFTVPLCHGHHRQLHQTGNEEAWWRDRQIDALESPEVFGSKAIRQQSKAHSIIDNVGGRKTQRKNGSTPLSEGIVTACRCATR